MGLPSSQVLALWVRESLCECDWRRLEDVCLSVVSERLELKDDECLEYVEQNLAFVADHLREESAECALDGRKPVFEIDEEPRPYIRLLQSLSEAKAVLGKLYSIAPLAFEDVCSNVLNKLGARASVAKTALDGGVDFLGFNLSFIDLELAVPQPCRTCVIGQAKRYKSTKPITETKVREFIGAATRRRHQFLKDGRLAALTPVIYAFWTTSSFDKNAREFSRDIGLWYMEGLTLADYIRRLDLTEYVNSIPSEAPKMKKQEDSEVINPSGRDEDM